VNREIDDIGRGEQRAPEGRRVRLIAMDRSVAVASARVLRDSGLFVRWYRRTVRAAGCEVDVFVIVEVAS